jgi:acyl-CoA dehydrogenase
MDIAYQDTERARELAGRTREFMEAVVLPHERAHPGGEPVPDGEIDALREQAREHGIYCPQIGEQWGGMGVDFRDALPVFEEAGRSLLGPPALRVDAPDEGNMHTLELRGTEAQKERYLRPLVEGEISSAFSMTEPQPGAGSDPKMLRTTARKEGDEWVIDGHKWWTSGGDSAEILIVMARTNEEAHPYEGCSLFLVPRAADGVNVVRNVSALGGDLVETGHAEIEYDGVRVPAENLLGERDRGFVHAQERLGPARLTHCMRFCGMADRALTVARTYLTEREAFGGSLADKQALRHRIADAETDLHAARTMVRHAAGEIAGGEQARVETAMTKNFTARTVQEAVDLAVQCCGGAGVSGDLPLADFYKGLRFFRIGDGPDEVHRRTIARAAFEDVEPAELANLPEF